MASVVELALVTGMRRGELLGLQWGDVDLVAGTLRVERSVEETRAGLRLKPPKTKRGRRSIGLGEGAIAMLRGRKVQQMELRLAIGAGAIKPDTLVFSTIEGELLSPDNLSRDWCRVRDRQETAADPVPRPEAHPRLGAAPGGRGRPHGLAEARPRQGKRDAGHLRPPDRRGR